MRKLGVEEWLVSAVMSMYTGAKTVVRTVYGNSNGFEVKVGMHQGSALSPLLFVMVKEATVTPRSHSNGDAKFEAWCYCHCFYVFRLLTAACDDLWIVCLCCCWQILTSPPSFGDQVGSHFCCYLLLSQQICSWSSDELFVYCVLYCFWWFSVLWHCWLGGRKGIRPIKKWVMGYWCGYLSGARCR